MRENRFLKADVLTRKMQNDLFVLDGMAHDRGESLAQMALAWVLHHEAVTSVLVGASSVPQLKQNLMCVNSAPFTEEEIRQIDAIVGG